MPEFIQSKMKVIKPKGAILVSPETLEKCWNTHFDHFIELDKLVNKSLIIYKSEYEVKGAYIHNESEFKLLSDYFAIGKTYAGRIEISNNYFRGEPDWYFLEGEDGGIDYPATWNFQTLSERKAEFQKFCDHLKELEKSKAKEDE